MRRADTKAVWLVLGALALASCAGAPPVWPPDGDTDAGHKDAGTPDAGEPDAGEPDAGEPDAGQPDAGPIDAGRPVWVTTAGGGAVRAMGTSHSVTLSVGQKAVGSSSGPAHRVQLGILRGTQAK